MILTTQIDPYRDQIEALNKVSFPSNQRRSLDYYVNDKGNNSDVIAILVEDEFAGFAVVLYTDKVAHLVYFAIEPEMQGEGFGSQVLQLLINYYYNKPLVADVENDDGDYDNLEERTSRINFYLRNGFQKTPVKYDWRGEDYIILSTRPHFTEEQLDEFWDTLKEENRDLISPE